MLDISAYASTDEMGGNGDCIEALEDVCSPLAVGRGRGAWTLGVFNESDDSVAERSEGDSAAATEGILGTEHPEEGEQSAVDDDGVSPGQFA